MTDYAEIHRAVTEVFKGSDLAFANLEFSWTKRDLREGVQNSATVVLGHSPHLLQSEELVIVCGGPRLITYSLGNFISGTARRHPLDPDGSDALVGDSIILPERSW
jgi:poly-gamma-glutamate capsule biosynthesis protein CapA/YwtB (metallophosphatase superfamily)